MAEQSPVTSQRNLDLTSAPAVAGAVRSGAYLVTGLD
ncbi:hypothetical protein CCUS01_00545 [Colletotrichum cuscutae]|uniref:Uncharacterized protein n=1 Tax=Colletotrichum cuscutae TaxID=1209917 RepID=A0AAI9Y481_9PEZI|nr:hypothetical protein CCUS01_00545 [Colletotrichum cuscutae]